MHARNRRTGAAITGTLETILGQCKLTPDGFKRSGDSRITHEHEGGTEMFWDSSKQVVENGQAIYLDENDEHVPASDIELHEGESAPDAARPEEPAPARNVPSDPDAAARGIAERFIGLMVTEVDAYHEALAAAREIGGTDGEEEGDKAVSEADDAFQRNAGTGIEGIEVASGLVDLKTARDALAPIIHHVETAIIRVEGPNALQIHCRREGERFYVNEVSAREYGQVCRVKPNTASATQANVYANAILDAWGATRD
ncbi:MAG: hypothetical protein OXG72_06225 [Acidobacteria bacterium]|nr:hypothetical protein [Acidobacteriota bacterium]